jgi:hypothetical protein
MVSERFGFFGVLVVLALRTARAFGLVAMEEILAFFLGGAGVSGRESDLR